MRSSRVMSLLGIAIEGQSFSAVLLRNKSGQVSIERTLEVTLSLNPQHDDPKLVGREIATHLESAGIRERRCVVCVPLTWVLSTSIKLPDLSEEDRKSYFSVQAEREFPLSPEDMTVAVSQYREPEGTQRATVVAIPNHRLSLLEKVVRSAKCRIQSVTLGTAALTDQVPHSEKKGALLLVFGENGIDMAIGCAGGILAIRRLNEIVGSNPDPRELFRQLRIALGQLSRSLRERVRRICVYGDEKKLASLIGGLREAFKGEGIAVEYCREGGWRRGEANPGGLSGDAVRLAPLVAATAKPLLGLPVGLEFLPKMRGKLYTLWEQLSARRLFWAAAVGVVLLGLCAGMVLHQRWRLGRLEAEWGVLEPGVSKVETLQAEIRKVRSWYEEIPQTLGLLKMLAEVFPEKGSVWITALGIKFVSDDSSAARSEFQEKPVAYVSIAGRATSKGELFAVRDRLSMVEGVEGQHMPQMQEPFTERNQILFTLKFSWTGDAGVGN